MEANAIQNTVGKAVAEKESTPCSSNAVVKGRVQEVEGNSSRWWKGKWHSALSHCPSHYPPCCVVPRSGKPSELWFTRSSLPHLETAPNCYQWPTTEKSTGRKTDSCKACQIWNCCLCSLQNSQISVMTFGLTWFEPPEKLIFNCIKRKHNTCR